LKEIRPTPAAQQDLSSIWDFTERHRGTREAKRCIGETRNLHQQMVPSRNM